VYLNLSDALLVPLRNDPNVSSFLPSKRFGSMVCGKPVIPAVGGEAGATFLDDVRHDRTPVASVSDTRAALVIVEAVYQESWRDHHA
jgi:hypothetical protein